MTKLSENALQQQVVQLAIMLGWQVVHFRPARSTQGWRTPLQGHAGFPDLVLAKGGLRIFAELKRDGQQPTAQQQAWLDALGPSDARTLVRCWRPRDWPEIERVLTGQAWPV